MKPSAFTVKIEKPCTVNLAGMNKHEFGLFCTHCDKNVIDFSGMSDEEIIRIVEKTSGKFCGRFSPRQLNRVFEATQNKPATPRLKKILAGLFALGMLEAGELNAEPIDGEKIVQTDSNKNVNEAPQIPVSPVGDTAKYVLHGILLDQYSNAPVCYATIEIPGTAIFTRSDSAGKFALVIPESITKDTFEIQISAARYYSPAMKIKKEELNSEKIFFLEEENMIDGGAMIEIVTPQKQKKSKKKD
jgi:hypothetical protein